MKKWSYMNSGADGLVTVTEDQILAAKAKWPDYAAQAQQVLDLEVGQSIAFPSGARYERLADDAAPINAIICRGRRAGGRKRCNYRQFPSARPCGREAPVLCDFQVAPGKTCDAPRCKQNSRVGGPDIDYCIEHPR